MLNIGGNIPSIKNSKTLTQSEIQNAKQNMNSTAGKDMILGAKLTPDTINIAGQGNISNSIPSLNGSTSVGSEELQNIKNIMQKNVNIKGLF